MCVGFFLSVVISMVSLVKDYYFFAFDFLTATLTVYVDFSYYYLFSCQEEQLFIYSFHY